MADSRSQRGREKYEILNILQKKNAFSIKEKEFLITFQGFSLGEILDIEK